MVKIRSSKDPKTLLSKSDFFEQLITQLEEKFTTIDKLDTKNIILEVSVKDVSSDKNKQFKNETFTILSNCFILPSLSFPRIVYFGP